MHTAKAIIAYPPSDDLNWKLREVKVRSVRDEELLVKIVASGLCHTDVVFGLMPNGIGGYPRVLGHEGAGLVMVVGSKVRTARPGDLVLLSYSSCSSCVTCRRGHPSFCRDFNDLNYSGKPAVFTSAEEKEIGGRFFGQSSFSDLTITDESSIVNVSELVEDLDELKVFAPLGCGFQTGAGAVTNLAAATDEDSLSVLGIGGVGLTSIIAAKIQGLKTIIAIDRFPARLELAKSLGATHVFNTSVPGFDLINDVRKATDGYGTSITIDTTGSIKLLADGLELTANRGQMILIGVPPLDAELSVHMIKMIQTGKMLRGCIEGDVVPKEYIKKMIQWYREGKFPIDKLIRYYRAEDFETALADVKSGATIKPVLLW